MKNQGNTPKVMMVQTSNNRWHIESESGVVMTEEIILGMVYEAEEYIKKYVSSHPTWTYEIITLERRAK